MISLDNVIDTITEDDLQAKIVMRLNAKGVEGFIEIREILKKLKNWEKTANYVGRVMNLAQGKLADDWSKIVTADFWSDDRLYDFYLAAMLGLFEGAVKISFWESAQDVTDTLAHSLHTAPTIDLYKYLSATDVERYKDRLSEAITTIGQFADGSERLGRIERYARENPAGRWRSYETDRHLAWFAIEKIKHAYLRSIKHARGTKILRG